MAHFREKSRMWPFAPRRSAVLARLPLPHRHATENILPSRTSLNRRRRPRSGGRSKVQAPLAAERIARTLAVATSVSRPHPNRVLPSRSEERRAGKERVSTCSYRWSTTHKYTKQKQQKQNKD